MNSLSYDHCPSDTRLLGQTIGQKLEEIASLYPEREALIDCERGVRMTYAELVANARQAAKGLVNLGVTKGDRVAVWSTNNTEWVVTQYATALIGALLVTINPAYKARELEYALTASRSKVLVMGAGFRDVSFLDLVLAVAPDLKGTDLLTCRTDSLPALQALISTAPRAGTGEAPFAHLYELGAQEDDDALTVVAEGLDIDDDINIQFTSGTTGFPKGATLTHHNILNNGYLTGLVMGFGPEERLCVPVPLYHCFGMVLGSLLSMSHGACMVMPSAWFDPEATLTALAAERCTALHGVPTMFIAELSHPRVADLDLSALRTGIMAGAPCPAELVREVMERMHVPELLIAYGQTEAAPLTNSMRASDPLEKRLTTVGRVLQHQELKVVDVNTGRSVPRGRPGEICVRGYNVMSGYDNNEEATRDTIDRRGWLHTGDLGVMDEEGFVRIEGRLKELVIRGGENIYPREIEDFLHTLDIILDAYVVGVPDPRYGEELAAAVRLQSGAHPLEATEFRALCKGHIADYKIPRHWFVVEDYPMTVTGKVQKFKLKEELIARLAAEK